MRVSLYFVKENIRGYYCSFLIDPCVRKDCVLLYEF